MNNKYVIMRDFKGARYVSLLIENLESAGDYKSLFLKLNEKNDPYQPIRVDERGGFCIFNPLDRSVIRYVESDIWPVLSLEELFPLNNKYFDCGWISPEKNTYFCDEEEYEKCAKIICNELLNKTETATSFEEELINTGWVKVLERDTFICNLDVANKEVLKFAVRRGFKPDKSIEKEF